MVGAAAPAASATSWLQLNGRTLIFLPLLSLIIVTCHFVSLSRGICLWKLAQMPHLFYIILHERTLNAAKLAVPISIVLFGRLLDMNCISNVKHQLWRMNNQVEKKCVLCGFKRVQIQTNLEFQFSNAHHFLNSAQTAVI